MAAVAGAPEKCTSKFLQEQLIKECLDRNTWSYNRMAGRLYASMTFKDLYKGSEIPSVRTVHDALRAAGLMKKLDYTDEEYALIDKWIDHNRDYRASYSELQQIRRKYALRNRVSGKEYETQQFVYMRVAMALAEGEDRSIRMDDVHAWYDHLSLKHINAPTPNFVNLGTHHNGFASCNVYTTDDTAASLAVGDHIAYMMTCMSAGIGAYINTRTLGDPVRHGSISHQGKLPYYRSLDGAVHANIQAGRGGACTVYYSCYDPEAQVISQLKNPMSPEDKRIRGMDYALITNRFFARKAAANEQVFTFTSYTAPKLHELLFGGNEEAFAKEYARLQASPTFIKNYISARDLLVTALNEAYETGRAYLFFADETNHHTPFKQPIYSSNLCFTGDTLVLLPSGTATTIKNLAEQGSEFDVFGATVHQRSGAHVWVPDIQRAVAFKTGEFRVVRVMFEDHSYIDCTPDHRLALSTAGKFVEAANSVGCTLEFASGDKMKVLTVVPLDGEQEVYDLSVSEIHTFYVLPQRDDPTIPVNAVLVHNCSEIDLPSVGYKSMKELYDDVADYETEPRGLPPEIGLCSLAGINVDHIRTEEEYADAMYYALKMIDRCIDMNDYVLPNLGVTAKARRSAGVGIIGLAHYLAKRHLNFSSPEGKTEINALAERHMYYAIKASLRLGRELGVAPWMDKTKWVDGWLPLDTYNRSVDALVPRVTGTYDWEALRKEIKEAGGLRNSVLCATPPSESCLSGETEVLLGDGTSKTMMELFTSALGGSVEAQRFIDNNPLHQGWIELPEPVSVKTRFGAKDVKSLWYNGEARYVTIALENGKKIRATASHKFLVRRGDSDVWVRASELRADDDIVELK